MRIDLNGDVGESFGAYTLGNDADLLRYVSSANIACGWHAGDPTTMRRTVKLAMQLGVAIGAHPGLPDLAGFGRRRMALTAEEVYEAVLYQIGALSAFVEAEGGKMRHVKPHGALYTMASTDRETADAVARAVRRFDVSLVLFGLAGSELMKAGQAQGLRTAGEAFADRTYQADGSLTDRKHYFALVDNGDAAAQQAIDITLHGKVRSHQGTELRVEANTICIHGDSPNAVGFAKAIRERLREAGVEIGPVE